MVDWHNPHEISSELGASTSFPLSIISVYNFTLFSHNSPSLVDASNKFTCVVDGVYMCVSLLPIDRYYSHRSKLVTNYGSWEYICSLHFEYGLLRGRRQWRWTDAVSTITPRHTQLPRSRHVFPNSSTSPVESLQSPRWLQVSLACVRRANLAARHAFVLASRDVILFTSVS